MAKSEKLQPKPMQPLLLKTRLLDPSLLRSKTWSLPSDPTPVISPSVLLAPITTPPTYHAESALRAIGTGTLAPIAEVASHHGETKLQPYLQPKTPDLK